MKKQTAVEWLVNEIDSNLLVTEKVKLAVELAKAMEKEQIMDAYNKNPQGYNHTAEQYYNETFKK